MWQIGLVLFVAIWADYDDNLIWLVDQWELNNPKVEVQPLCPKSSIGLNIGGHALGMKERIKLLSIGLLVSANQNRDIDIEYDSLGWWSVDINHMIWHAELTVCHFMIVTWYADKQMLN